MILSDREIRAARARQALGIHPEPLAAAWSSTAVDLTLGEPVSIWDPGSANVFSPHSPDYDFSRLARQHAREVLLGEAGYVMEQSTFLLGWTAERLCLPHASRIAARVEGKSGLARLGLGVHVTAPTIHSGFGATEDPHFTGSPIRLEIGTSGLCGSSWRRGCPSAN